MNQLNKLRAENNLLDKNLSQENDSMMKDMVCYLRSSDLCNYDLEMMRKELTGMALEAQLRGEDFQKVIGDDYKAFCNELMASGRRKTMTENLLEMLHILISGIGSLFLIEIVFSSALKQFIQSGQPMLPVTNGFLISTILIIMMALGVYTYMTKNSFELSQRASNSKLIFGIGFAAAWVVILLCKVFLKTPLFTVNLFVPLAFFTLAYIASKVVNDKYVNHFFMTEIKTS